MAFEYLGIGLAFYAFVVILIILGLIVLVGILLGGGKKGVVPSAKKFGKMFKPFKMDNRGQIAPVSIILFVAFLLAALFVGGIFAAIYAVVYFFGGFIAMFLLRLGIGKARSIKKSYGGKGKFK